MRKPIGKRLEAALEAFLSSGPSPSQQETLEQENEALARMCLALEDAVEQERARAQRAESRLVFTVAATVCGVLSVGAAQALYLGSLMSLWMLLPAFVAWMASGWVGVGPSLLERPEAVPRRSLTPTPRLLSAPESDS